MNYITGEMITVKRKPKHRIKWLDPMPLEITH
jgi:hypothetical protein